MSQNRQKPGVLKLVREVKSLASNGGVLNWLRYHPFFGNLLLVLLVVYAGKNLLETFIPQEPDPNFISKKEICNQLKGSTKAGFQELKQTGPHTTVSVKDLTEDYFPFVCSYSFQGTSESIDVRIQEQSLREDLLPPYGEEPEYRSDRISEAELDDLCRRPDLYPEKVQQRVNRPADTYTITPQGVSLNNDTRVWPVFRWKCSYKINFIDPTSTPSDWAGDEPVKIGLILTEEYCHSEHDNTYAAFYYDYNNPHSWYCTVPNRDAKKIEQ